MTDDQHPERRAHGATPIAPPPSLQEFLEAGEGRLGRVDLGLGGRPSSPHPEEQAPAREPAPAEAAPQAPTSAPARRLRAVGDRRPPAPEVSPQPPSQVSDLPAAPQPAPARAQLPPAPEPASRTPRTRPAPPVGGLGAPEEELRQLSRSVAEVAASVIARMREAGEANRRHLEALEAEAARRCELLTAQAELDAELIRLHARREAHAIVAAARLRSEPGDASRRSAFLPPEEFPAGPPADPPDVSADALGEVTETFAHFAELFGDPLAADLADEDPFDPDPAP